MSSEKIVTFGEIMLRLSPPGFQRFSQARSFDVIFGGGEANVAASLANYGLPVEFVTCLPKNDIGSSCRNFLRERGVGVDNIIWGGNRLGIYFFEIGAVSRASKVIYDRANSALAEIKPGLIDWGRIFEDASWFHWTGITPAISKGAADVCLEALTQAKKAGLTISCDLNYRKKLWKWGKEPSEIMPELVQFCDIAIGNEEDAAKVFDIHAPETDVTKGDLEAERYRSVCVELNKRFSNLKTIAITLRGSRSASYNTWSAVLWDAAGSAEDDGGTFFTSAEYDIFPIIDRVGGGDSFVGGLIYGLLSYKEKQRALDFAVAASCLKHTIFGDFNLVSVDEVEKLMGGDQSGRVSR